MGSHGIYKECDWPEKDCFCLCHGASHDAKLRRHKRKGCSRCHGNKASDGVPRAMKSLDPLYPTATSPTANLHTETGGEEEREEEQEVDAEVKDEVDSGANSPHPEEQGAPSWEGPEEGSLPIPEEKEEEDDEEDKDGGENIAPRQRGVRGMEKARGCLMAPQHPLAGRWRTLCSLVPTPLLIPQCVPKTSPSLPVGRRSYSGQAARCQSEYFPGNKTPNEVSAVSGPDAPVPHRCLPGQLRGRNYDH